MESERRGVEGERRSGRSGRREREQHGAAGCHVFKVSTKRTRLSLHRMSDPDADADPDADLDPDPDPDPA